MNKIDLMRTLQAPVVSEKTARMQQDNYYVFRVLTGANKVQVKNAVELMFSVKVDSVRIVNVVGKDKRVGRVMGRRSDWKKAYVKLKPDFSIDLGNG